MKNTTPMKHRINNKLDSSEYFSNIPNDATLNVDEEYDDGEFDTATSAF